MLLGLLGWLLGMVAERRLAWRCSALDWPLGLLIALVIVQLALGNRPLVAWALAPPGSPDAPPAFPSLVLTLGTLAPPHTISALRIFLTYAGAYVLVVHLIRTRAQLDRLMSTLLILGGGLAFLGLLDYLGREAWLLRWRNTPATGRLSGTFANPDHFGAWLTMLIFLGIGYLLARRGPAAGGPSLRGLLRSPARREEAARRYLPFLALVIMAVALVFTLSRGAVVSALIAVLLLLALLRALGRIRRSLALVGALLVATLGYAAWIGFEPLLTRLWHADYTRRWVQTPCWGSGWGRIRTSLCATSRPCSTRAAFITRTPTTISSSWCSSWGSSERCSSWRCSGRLREISWAPTFWVAPRARSEAVRPRGPAGTTPSASGWRWAR